MTNTCTTPIVNTAANMAFSSGEYDVDAGS